jgi:FAD:protein FMN transferase
MPPVILALHAMATRFELVLHGDNATRLCAAGEAALREVERLEAQLSLYRPTSEIARVNALAAREPVRVSPSVFRLLQHARQLQAESGGAFDITVAPLVRCWGFMHGTGRVPEPAEIEEARSCCGMTHVILDEQNYSVRFDREGVMIDLGAIGKGHAIDCAAEIFARSRRDQRFAAWRHQHGLWHRRAAGCQRLENRHRPAAGSVATRNLSCAT